MRDVIGWQIRVKLMIQMHEMTQPFRAPTKKNNKGKTLYCLGKKVIEEIVMVQ